VKQLLAREEALSPTIFANLRSALLPLMGEGVYPYMNLVRAQVENNIWKRSLQRMAVFME
jgi:hypothetical protein